MGTRDRRGILLVSGEQRYGSEALQAIFDEHIRLTRANPNDPVSRAASEALANAAAKVYDFLGGTALRGAIPPTDGIGWFGDFYLEIVYTLPYPVAPTTCNLYGPKTASGWGNPIPIGGVSSVPLPMTVVSKTASWTFDITLTNAYVLADSASALTGTIPANSSVAYAIGTVLQWSQQNTGQLTLAPDSGVTLHTAETLKMRKRYSSGAAVQIATDVWNVTGDLELA